MKSNFPKILPISFLFIFLSTLLYSQLPAHTQDFRGLWVTKFKNNVLGNTSAENDLLAYAVANDFNYLICTNMFTILTEDCGSFSPEMIDLQAFVEKAHNDYGIAYISGNVGSETTAEKVQDYNNCGDVTDAQKFDMITYECEFYNPATNGSCPSYSSFIGQVNGIKTICDATLSSDPTKDLICEVYIGGEGSTGLVITNSSEAEMEEIASVADHILLTYYRSTPSSSGGNFFNWTIQRLEWIASPTAVPSNVVLLLKSRDTDSNNMYDYLTDFAGTHFDAVRDPYYSWVEGMAHNPALSAGYIEQYADGTYPWLEGIKIEGFTWFENEANLEISDALPVEFVRFDAVLMPEKAVKLKWETAIELQNDYFLIEHSSDGKNWKERIKIAGSGTSYTTQNYEWIDQFPDAGANYYRIKQVDFDGAYAYSSFRFIELPSTFQFFPNPATSYLRLEGINLQIAPLNIYSLLGE